MPTFQLPKMNNDEVENLIKEQILCRIAFGGEKYPYMAPFQYVFTNGNLYFHFTDYGRKMKLLQKDKRVCVEIEEYKPDLSEYRFIVLQGTLEIVTNPQERGQVINKMAETGKHKLSPNFLPAHGLMKNDGWGSLIPEKPLIIIKLVQVSHKIGLKSP